MEMLATSYALLYSEKARQFCKYDAQNVVGRHWEFLTP